MRSETQWQPVKFGDVVRNVRETENEPLKAGLERYVGLGDIEPEDLHIRSWGMIEDGTSFNRLFRKGQVLFARRRAYQRKVAVAEWDGVCSGDLMVFEPTKDQQGNVRLIPELLPFIVQSESFFQYVLDMSQGSLSPRVKWKDLAQYEFALPPLEEQRRIAEILWAVDKTIESHTVTLGTLVELRDAALEGFLQDGMRGWHTEYQRFPSGRAPKNWRYVKCKEVYAEPPRNGYSPRTNANKQGYPTLSISAVEDGEIIAEGEHLKWAEIPPEKATEYKIHPGDILVVRGNGNRDLVGRCGIVNDAPAGCFYPDLLIRITFDPSVIRPEFAAMQWNSPSVHRRLQKRAKTTSGIWKINGKDLREHRLLVPPLVEQDAFLANMQSYEAASSAAENNLRQTEVLKQSLLFNLLESKK